MSKMSDAAIDRYNAWKERERQLTERYKAGQRRLIFLSKRLTFDKKASKLMVEALPGAIYRKAS